MIQLFKKIFGLGPSVDYKTLCENGAQIVDVRTKGEFHQGHIRGSINIPLNELSRQTAKLKKEKAIICCCASGMRSAQGKGILRSNGFAEVYNGGGWMRLKNRIS